jgi:hypothetical protein
MIACIDPGSAHHGESLTTARFAAKARTIRNDVAVNLSDPVLAELFQLREDKAQLLEDKALLQRVVTQLCEASSRAAGAGALGGPLLLQAAEHRLVALGAGLVAAGQVRWHGVRTLWCCPACALFEGCFRPCCDAGRLHGRESDGWMVAVARPGWARLSAPV